MTSRLQASDAAAAAVARGPRVTLAEIEGRIAQRHDFTARQAIVAVNGVASDHPELGPLGLLSICVLVTRNGYTVVGTSACAAPENFDRALGARYAYEHAVRQLWPLEGYLLRDKLAQAAAAF